MPKPTDVMILTTTAFHMKNLRLSKLGLFAVI